MAATATDQTRAPRLGDRIQLATFPHTKGRIVEFVGPIGHKGEEMYGLELHYSEHSSFTVAPRGEFEYLDDGNDPAHPNPPTQD